MKDLETGRWRTLEEILAGRKANIIMTVSTLHLLREKALIGILQQMANVLADGGSIVLASGDISPPGGRALDGAVLLHDPYRKMRTRVLEQRSETLHALPPGTVTDNQTEANKIILPTTYTQDFFADQLQKVGLHGRMEARLINMPYADSVDFASVPLLQDYLPEVPVDERPTVIRRTLQEDIFPQLPSDSQHPDSYRTYWTYGVYTKSRPAAAPDSLQAVTAYIRGRMTKFSSDTLGQLLCASWMTVLEEPRNPVMQTMAHLASAGVALPVLNRIVSVLMGLEIDVANPWTVSYILSDIIGYLSPQLLGMDIHAFKSVARDVDFVTSPTLRWPGDSLPADLGKTQDVVAELHREYYELRRRQERLLYSDRPYREIQREIETSSDAFVDKFVRVVLPRIWAELKIPADSAAFVYFRHMKTFASDLDLFYWGPRAPDVNLRLTQIAFQLGLKRDYWSATLLQTETEQGRVDFDVYNYFFSGPVIEINGGSFQQFRDLHLTPHINRTAMWSQVYPYLCRQLAVWNGEDASLPLKLSNMKKLQYKTLTNLLFRLLVKFNLDDPADPEDLLNHLRRHMDPAEIEILEDAILLVNQARNINQVISRRRWE